MGPSEVPSPAADGAQVTRRLCRDREMTASATISATAENAAKDESLEEGTGDAKGNPALYGSL